MVNFCNIEQTLSKLEDEYSSCSDVQMSILYSKLAVLEICGWIETSLDVMLYDYVDTHICLEGNKKSIKKIIDKVYGFKFDEHIFPLLCSVLGVNNVENILDSISEQDLQTLKTLLGKYAKERDKAAHKNIEGVTMQYTAPSVVLYDYKIIKIVLAKIEKSIMSL